MMLPRAACSRVRGPVGARIRARAPLAQHAHHALVQTQAHIDDRRPGVRHGSADIHPTAVIHPTAEVGAFCVVGARARVGPGTRLASHVVLGEDTVVGADCELHSFCVVGGPSQSKRHREPASPVDTRVVLGDGVVVREHVTVNRGSQSETRVGNGTHLLSSSHVGHDCVVGAHCVVSSGALLAGHVVVGDGATLGGASTVLQFVHIGRLCMVGGSSAVDCHVPPFSLVQGNRARLRGANLVGLRRHKIPREEIQHVLRALRFLFGTQSAGTEDWRLSGRPPTTLTDRARITRNLFHGKATLIHEIADFAIDSSERWGAREAALGFPRWASESEGPGGSSGSGNDLYRDIFTVSGSSSLQ